MIKSMIPEIISMLFLGGGLSYIIEKKNYSHIPILILFPEVYCGYNIYKHRNTIIDTLKPA
jgi:hypothetical protein